MFDLGQVLFLFDWQPALEIVSRHSPLDADTIRKVVVGHEKHRGFELGLTTEAEFFAWLRTELRVDAQAPSLEHLWNGIFQPQKENLEIFERVRRTHRVAIVSNTNPAHARHLETICPALLKCDRRFYSFEVGLRKPDPAIFRMALEAMGARPGHTLFVDDLEENVRAADAIGIQTIHFTGHRPLLEDFRKRGLLE